jgi:DNA-binding response OmpR family regulator
MTEEACILIVDDQPDLLSGLALTLDAAGYCVVVANDGTEALTMLQTKQVDLILADIAMPHMNGYQLYERVRENTAWISIPFLFLTARAMDSDIRYGKQLGVDDYLTKPIQPEDLLAAVEGKLRRAQQLRHSTPAPAAAPIQEAHTTVVHVGPLAIDVGQHRVWMHDQAVQLSAREFTLLEYLMRRVDTVVSPQELVQATHNLATDHEEAGALLRPLIRSLRRKLGYPVGDMGCIEVVRGVGYRLTEPTIEGHSLTGSVNSTITPGLCSRL